MLFGQVYFALVYFQFNRVILRCACLTQCTDFIYFCCLFLNCTLLGGFKPSGQAISVCISTVAVFTPGLVAAAAWAYVVFTELNMSICFLASVYEIHLSAFIL